MARDVGIAPFAWSELDFNPDLILGRNVRGGVLPGRRRGVLAGLLVLRLVLRLEEMSAPTKQSPTNKKELPLKSQRKELPKRKPRLLKSQSQNQSQPLSWRP